MESVNSIQNLFGFGHDLTVIFRENGGGCAKRLQNHSYELRSSFPSFLKMAHEFLCGIQEWANPTCGLVGIRFLFAHLPPFRPILRLIIVFHDGLDRCICRF